MRDKDSPGDRILRSNVEPPRAVTKCTIGAIPDRKVDSVRPKCSILAGARSPGFGGYFLERDVERAASFNGLRFNL